MHATSTIHLILLDLFTLIMFGKLLILRSAPTSRHFFLLRVTKHMNSHVCNGVQSLDYSI